MRQPVSAAGPVRICHPHQLRDGRALVQDAACPPDPHDALFRALLSDPGRAGAFLREHLPNSITGHLTADPPEILEGSFVYEASRGQPVRSSDEAAPELRQHGSGLRSGRAQKQAGPGPAAATGLLICCASGNAMRERMRASCAPCRPLCRWCSTTVSSAGMCPKVRAR